MKKIFLTALLPFATAVFAQATIDKTARISTSSSLEFGDNQNKGIVVPWVNSTTAANTSGAVNGTVILDISDGRMKVKENNLWKDYSTQNATVNATSQTSATEVPALKAVVGATNSSAPGVMILEENNKALILPRESSPHLNIKNPAPGMMVYDTVKKQVAFYNGAVWSFWQ